MRLYEIAGVGVVANNKKQANDPRYSNSITQDIKPGESQRQAAKFGNKVDSKGHPPKLNAKYTKNTTPNKLWNLGIS